MRPEDWTFEIESARHNVISISWCYSLRIIFRLAASLSARPASRLSLVGRQDMAALQLRQMQTQVHVIGQCNPLRNKRSLIGRCKVFIILLFHEAMPTSLSIHSLEDWTCKSESFVDLSIFVIYIDGALINWRYYEIKYSDFTLSCSRSLFITCTVSHRFVRLNHVTGTYASTVWESEKRACLAFGTYERRRVSWWR